MGVWCKGVSDSIVCEGSKEVKGSCGNECEVKGKLRRIWMFGKKMCTYIYTHIHDRLLVNVYLLSDKTNRSSPIYVEERWFCIRFV